MKRCKLCVMTDTRLGIKFNKEGVCYPCLNFENRKNIDWNERWEELEDLCDKHRQNDGHYDCVITISGGKDSHYQVYLFKEVLKMNPLGIMIDNFSWTETGRMNFNNISERFGIDILTFTPNRKLMKEKMRSDFIEYLHPAKHWDEILYRKPLELAKKFGIDLIVWGENVNMEIGGLNYKETSNALCLTEKPEEFKSLDVIFTSYYIPWSRFRNVELAKKKGFKSLNDTKEWEREGYKGFEYEQVDTIGYLTNAYCKFIKFGFSSITEFCSDAIRHSKMEREEAINIVKNNDWKIDPIMLEDFCRGLNITKEFFWKIVDKFANREILEKRNDMWRLKDAM